MPLARYLDRRRLSRRLSALLVAGLLAASCGRPAPSSEARTSPPGSGGASPTGSAGPSPSGSSGEPSGSAPAGAGSWVAAGGLPADPSFGGPIWPTAIALTDGRALVVGSDNRCSPGGPVFTDGHSVSVFDPASGAWTPTTPLNKDRGFFIALSLPDGRAMVTGGANSIDNGELSFSSTKLWDPVSGAWTDGDLLSHARTGGFGTLLPDGRVLVGGGYYYDGKAPQRALSSAEVYDIEQDRWTDVPSMSSALQEAKAVALADGRALVVGIADGASGDLTWRARLFDPANDTWEDAPPPPANGLGAYELVALDDGDAVALFDHPYRFDGATDAWEIMGLDRNTTAAQAARLADGRVIVAGGQAPEAGADPDTWPALADVDVYDPATDTFTAVASLPDGRQDGDLAVLGDGSVLFVAGATAANPTSTPGCPSARSDAIRYLPGG